MIHTLFLEAVKASLTSEYVDWEQPLSTEDWQALFRLAREHHVLPLVYEAVYRCPAAQQADPAFFAAVKRQVFQIVMVQTRKSSEFLQLYRHLQAAGVTPLVVKGIVCRSLYPKPDCRTSSDEDLLILPEDFPACHQAMLDFGMQVRESGLDIETAYEVPYCKDGSPIYIELHKHLFPPESAAYGDLNRYFGHVHRQHILLELPEGTVATLGCTDHFFYLICHAFKHFLHSGFGIRQVCDISFYANTYGPQLDWDKLLVQCREIRAHRFTAALLKIAEKHLNFSAEQACYPVQWQQIPVDETAMLEDLLSGGVYGGATKSRQHSSRITLNAVAEQKQGQTTGRKLRNVLFPPATSLKTRYPYLEKHPYLLPMAWCSRIVQYGCETLQTPENSAADSLKIADRRIDMLREYGILDGKDPL